MQSYATGFQPLSSQQNKQAPSSLRCNFPHLDHNVLFFLFKSKQFPNLPLCIWASISKSEARPGSRFFLFVLFLFLFFCCCICSVWKDVPAIKRRKTLCLPPFADAWGKQHCSSSYWDALISTNMDSLEEEDNHNHIMRSTFWGDKPESLPSPVIMLSSLCLPSTCPFGLCSTYLHIRAQGMFCLYKWIISSKWVIKQVSSSSFPSPLLYLHLSLLR